MHLHLLLWSHSYKNLFSLAKYHSCACQGNPAAPADVISFLAKVVHQTFLPLSRQYSIKSHASFPLITLHHICIWVWFVLYIICRLITSPSTFCSRFSIFLLGTQSRYSTLLPLPFVSLFKMQSCIIALPEPSLHPQEWLARLAAVSKVCLANPLIALCLQCCEP